MLVPPVNETAVGGDALHALLPVAEDFDLFGGGVEAGQAAPRDAVVGAAGDVDAVVRADGVLEGAVHLLAEPADVSRVGRRRHALVLGLGIPGFSGIVHPPEGAGVAPQVHLAAIADDVVDLAAAPAGAAQVLEQAGFRIEAEHVHGDDRAAVDPAVRARVEPADVGRHARLVVALPLLAVDGVVGGQPETGLNVPGRLRPGRGRRRFVEDSRHSRARVEGDHRGRIAGDAADDFARFGFGLRIAPDMLSRHDRLRRQAAVVAPGAVAGVEAAQMPVRMGADVDAAVTGKEGCAGEALAADGREAVRSEPAGVRTPRQQQVSRLEEAVVGRHPQQAGLRVRRGVEFAAADAMLLHHLAAVDVDGEQHRTFLPQLRPPQQVAVPHRVAQDPATLKPAPDDGTTQIVENAHAFLRTG